MLFPFLKLFSEEYKFETFFFSWELKFQDTFYGILFEFYK
jgi:hypothetical protein